MDIQKEEKYTLVSINKHTFSEFKFGWDAFISNHLILKVSENLNIDDVIISLFLDIANNFKQSGVSFIVLKSRINVDELPEVINTVPTLQEAKDVLEMEAIERELGL